MCAKLLQSHLTLCDPMDCSLPAPLSMGFSRQEYWSELPCPPPRDLPDPRTQVSCVSCIGSRFFTTSTTWEAPQTVYLLANKLSKTELLNSEENIGFQTTFSLDILEDPKFLGVQIAWLQKEWESWTYLPGTSTIARHQGQQETCWEGGLSYLPLSLLQKRRHVSCRHSLLSRITLRNTRGEAASPGTLTPAAAGPGEQAFPWASWLRQ